VIDLDALDRRIDERIAAGARPLFVSQRNCLAVVGLEPRDYLHHARGGAFPTTKERRLVVAKMADVVAWLEARIERSTRPANVTPIEGALARVGARRVAS
jgi:hypothetical protein